jgi:putative FmdB family regulatory protein
MPTYEYLCRDCGEHFEQRRPMSASADPAHCPQGHRDTVKLLSTVALAGRSSAAGTPVTAGATAPSGGCCGGACGCGG